MKTEGSPCLLCGKNELPHAQAEARGEINHRWTDTGKLIPVDPKSRRKSPQSPILVVGAVDTGLRKLLLDKGLLTHEDFASLLGAGPSTEGDRGAGETPSSE
jgi:hypothetical protein